MPKVRGNPGNKYRERASQASSAYAEGIANPRKNWAAATLAAAENQATGVQQAIAEKRFAKGVQRAGDAKYQRGAQTKGVGRYAQGVSEAEGDYTAGIAPFLQTIEATTLPPRFPKGDPRNYDRSKTMGTALHAKKRSM